MLKMRNGHLLMKNGHLTNCCCGPISCCGIEDFSVTLTGTITDKVGDATTLPDTVSLPRTGAHWQSAAAVIGECIIQVNCSDQDPELPDTQVQWWLEPTACWPIVYRTSVSCDPLVVVFHVVMPGFPYSHTGSFTLTVTL
jgi:hypothetical protein